MATGLVTFHDNVVMVQAGRRMSCDRAEALIEEEGGMQSLFCEGSVEVDDTIAGRNVTGDDARYDVSDGEITFHGTPVVMIGEKGEQIEGASLVYDLATGAARIERGTGSGTATPAAEENPPVDIDDGTDSDSSLAFDSRV
jgi:lipopolysaccharide transport protein LptA